MLGNTQTFKSIFMVEFYIKDNDPYNNSWIFRKVSKREYHRIYDSGICRQVVSWFKDKVVFVCEYITK